MRRSKSNPAKYTRNYRSISQRRMTAHDDNADADDDEKEMERLRKILQQGEANLMNAEADDDTEGGKRKRDDNDDQQAYGNDDDLVFLSKKKKKSKSKPRVELTPQELKQAKQLHKNAARKLQQLETRAAQKVKRQELYQKLKNTALDSQTSKLLQSSATLGKRVSKKERLKQLLQRERAGVALSEAERELLYSTTEVNEDDDADDSEQTAPMDQEAEPNMTTTTTNSAGATTNVAAEEEDNSKPSTSKASKKKKKKRKRKDATTSETAAVVESSSSNKALSEVVQQPDNAGGSSGSDPSIPEKEKEDEQQPSGVDNKLPGVSAEETESTAADPMKNHAHKKESSVDDEATAAAPSGGDGTSAFSFASQMMASLSKLKVESQAASATLEEQRQEAERQAQLEEEERNRLQTKRYVPDEPIELKTAATLGITPTNNNHDNRKSPYKVREVKRPADVAATRYDLPVAGMEFEVMDAIRNNDVTIICAETGSGKSTQVPQFLYESGLTREGCMVGVTQPRRVAAVSTAKRVCYEMGHGNGRSIQSIGGKGKGNLVAYQTRYETAGLGSSTHIKMMTDGILLQEIQSDLLLRKYSVIVLDESHERGINSDVLIGLLSAALPLRKQAAAEEGSSLPPLKIVIMSATLRVEDFTENADLFPNITPAVVRVPGRTFPVTIHHSKVTELENYEEAAFKKICKIHRKLPQGGILVFLTGRQEIVRMVKRLRKCLSLQAKSNLSGGFEDVSVGSALEKDGPREADDEEIDGDIFRSSERDDFDDMEQQEGDEFKDTQQQSDDTDGIPKYATILPLYSLLSADDQAKVFAPVAEGQRLIVVATNIAETSITIPGISYVVCSGRQKCRNYNAATGMASFDVMWISKAAADQRAGRAGRTGPGHCYRLYSSSMYSRHMDSFALPEVLTRPLEDVVLAMKAMKISNVGKFPFPTPPDRSQIASAVKQLANIGCIDLSGVEAGDDGDGEATRLGVAVSKLPLGVRFGKMLLVAAQAGILDYAIAMVASLSEITPFVHHGQTSLEEDRDSDDDDQTNTEEETEGVGARKKSQRWRHKAGDALATMLAVGAYTYAGHGAGGASERVACRNFCEKNGLNPVVMERIQKMRIHLARLAKVRLANADGIAAKTGGILSSMPPPSKVQERLLCQSIASGLLDHVAMLAPLGSIPGEHPLSLRSAYLSCSTSVKDPLFLDRNSVVYSRDARLLPKWICYESLMRKTLKDGTVIAVMKNITPVDPAWLGMIAKGTRMLSIGEPLPSPQPCYDAESDAVVCSAMTRFGSRGWEIPPLKVEMFDALQAPEAKQNSHFSTDDSFRWFARFLLEGKVIKDLEGLEELLSDSPAIITRRTPISKVAVLVSTLAGEGIDTAAALRKHWAQVDSKFLFPQLKSWVKKQHHSEAKRIWVDSVKKSIKQFVAS